MSKDRSQMSEVQRWVADSVSQALAIPVKPAIDDARIREIFSPPATLGKRGEVNSKYAQDSALTSDLDPARSLLSASLLDHTIELGQIPFTGFLGYGALQLIAQNGMIRACIKTVADEMTREFIALEGGSDSPDGNRLDELKDKIENSYRIRELFNRAFSLVGFMGGALIYVDTGLTNSPEALKTPLLINANSAELNGDTPLRFVLIDPVNVSPGAVNASNSLRHDYMKPATWFIDGIEVHASRLITLFDNEPPAMLKPAYNFLGIPQAQILWDYVAHWNKARVEGVELLSKLNTFVFKTDMSSVLTSAHGVEQLDAQMLRLARYRDSNSVLVIDKEAEDAVNVTQTISGARELITQSLEFIAAINGTPAVKLLGQSPSGFNATGESDIRNYYDHIRAKQELYRPAIQKVLDVIQLVEFGQIDESIRFSFAELGTEDEASEAMTAKTQIDALAVLLDRNVISAEEAREAVKSSEVLALSTLSDEMPEPIEGSLQTEDPSSGNTPMQAFLAQREQNAVQREQARQLTAQGNELNSKINELAGRIDGNSS